MKNLIAVLSLSFLLSCSEEVFKEEFLSPDQKTKIVIDAKRSGKLDSWKVETTIKSKSFDDGSLRFEIYNGELKDHIHIDWSDSEHATISFDQTDGVSRKFQLISSPTQLHLEEIKQ